MPSSEQISLETVTGQLQAGKKVSVELLEIFHEEAEEHLRIIYEGLDLLDSNQGDFDALATVRRSSHTLKGAAGAVGLQAITRLSHRMEDLLDSLAETKTPVTDEQLKLILTSTDQITELTQGDFKIESTAVKILSLYQEFEKALAEFEASTPSTNVDPFLANSNAEPVWVEPSTPVPATGGNQKFLRVPLQRLDDLVGLASEMIVNRSAIQQQLDCFEVHIAELRDAIGRMRSTSRELESRYSSETLQTSGCWAVEDAPVAMAGARSLHGSSATGDLDSLEFDKYTNFHLLAQSLSEGNNDIQVVADELNGLKLNFENLMRRQDQLNRETQNSLMHVRMVPLGGIVSRLQRTVRTVSAKVGKSVKLQVIGEHTDLDKTVLDAIVDPLQHLIRNAIDHGVESSDQRRVAGKPIDSILRLEAIHLGTQITLRIIDDGNGIDVQRVRSKAIQNGLIQADSSLPDEELFNLIFMPGFSTADSLTEVSGRGVGMDVVRDAITRLKGTVRVESQPGVGTTFTIQLPTSVGVTRALIVQASGSSFAIPMQSVRKIQRLQEGAVDQRDNQHFVAIAGRTLRLRDLTDHLQLETTETAQEKFAKSPPLLVINLGVEEVAISVDRVLGGREIVVKSLGDILQKVPGLLGATVQGDGTIIPILDPVDLVTNRSAISGNCQRNISQKRVSTAMIIDDSISVRRVTSNLLQQAGWETVTAKDGVDAIEQLGELETTPHIFLCDMEMPRMDGIELVKRLRNMPRFTSTPIVMVTSRASEKHRHLAFDAGATDYVVKPYDDEHLLKLIDSLVHVFRVPSGHSE